MKYILFNVIYATNPFHRHCFFMTTETYDKAVKNGDIPEWETVLKETGSEYLEGYFHPVDDVSELPLVHRERIQQSGTYKGDDFEWMYWVDQRQGVGKE